VKHNECIFKPVTRRVRGHSRFVGKYVYAEISETIKARMLGLGMCIDCIFRKFLCTNPLKTSLLSDYQFYGLLFLQYRMYAGGANT